MPTNLENLIEYDKFSLRDCIKLRRAWSKRAFAYKRIIKKAKMEQPPGINVLLCGVLQTLVSRKKYFIEKASEIVKNGLPEDTILALGGSALVDAGYINDGLAKLRKAVEINPSAANMEALAGSIENSENYAEKFDLANRILEKDSNDIDGLRHKIFVLIQWDRLDEAENVVQKAFNLAPKNGSIHEACGEIQFRRGKYREALMFYKKAYNYFSRTKHVWQQMAYCYFELGKIKKAKKAALKLLKLAKQDGDDIKKYSSLRDFFDKLGVKCDF